MQIEILARPSASVAKLTLSAGERVIVNGLQRVRPGALVAPRLVPMLAHGADKTTGGS